MEFALESFEGFTSDGAIDKLLFGNGAMRQRNDCAVIRSAGFGSRLVRLAIQGHSIRTY